MKVIEKSLESVRPYETGETCVGVRSEEAQDLPEDIMPEGLLAHEARRVRPRRDRSCLGGLRR